MLIRRPDDIKSSEITEPEVYKNRRRFIRQAVAAGLAVSAGGVLLPKDALLGTAQAATGEKLKGVIKNSRYTVPVATTPYKLFASYNNFYEFSTDKAAPAELAKNFQTRPWKIKVDGEVARPTEYDIDDLIKLHKLEERVYRFRCVEAWSMVVPWVGIPLRDVIKRLRPTSKAKYVAFETLHDPQQMPGQRGGFLGGGLDWPYVEGLRMDEAMHPLTLLAVGAYGDVMPNQNGAPIRLVVPWKYGFKSIKSIVRISFTEQEPPATWNQTNPREYGFYSNVNPQVDHPRWSQKRERRLGDGIFSSRHETLMFNGYADQVAGLYTGMDLSKHF